MRRSLRDRIDATLDRTRRVERRELRDPGRWLERIDVLVHRSPRGRTRWQRVIVPVRRASDVDADVAIVDRN
jgi:hypothetical protein